MNSDYFSVVILTYPSNYEKKLAKKLLPCSQNFCNIFSERGYTVYQNPTSVCIYILFTSSLSQYAIPSYISNFFRVPCIVWIIVIHPHHPSLLPSLRNVVVLHHHSLLLPFVRTTVPHHHHPLLPSLRTVIPHHHPGRLAHVALMLGL